jgi:hypothetical protein
MSSYSSADVIASLYMIGSGMVTAHLDKFSITRNRYLLLSWIGRIMRSAGHTSPRKEGIMDVRIPDL